MNLMEALNSRRSVREFLPDAVSREVLEELVVAAALAPSYMNLQPWSFAVTAEPARVEQLGQQATHHLRESTPSDSPLSSARAEFEAPGFDVFYGAPALIVVCATQAGFAADIACAMAAQNLMLAAGSMGLGSCWVSFAQPWLASSEGRKALGIGADERPVAPIIVGGPGAAPLSPGRFRPRLHWIGTPSGH